MFLAVLFFNIKMWYKVLQNSRSLRNYFLDINRCFSFVVHNLYNIIMMTFWYPHDAVTLTSLDYECNYLHLKKAGIKCQKYKNHAECNHHHKTKAISSLHKRFYQKGTLFRNRIITRHIFTFSGSFINSCQILGASLLLILV